MPKVSAEHRESRRAEILCAARRRFARDGFHATSMQDILDESGMSAGAVYTYFPSKTEIISAIATENVASLLEFLSGARSGDLSVADVIVSTVQSIRAKDDPASTARLALQVWAESARDPQLRTQSALIHDNFRSVLAELITSRHPDRAADADCMAGVVGTLVTGFLMQAGLVEPQRYAQFERGVRLVLADL